MAKSIEQRFWEKINKHGPVSVYDGKPCWLWLGYKNNHGHGVFTSHGSKYGKIKKHLTHRFVWMLMNGNIPKNMNVLHSCDVRNCVNPDHLFLGTQADNVADMIQKGRFKNAPHKWSSKSEWYYRSNEERFWEWVDKSGDSGCWLWLGGKDYDGYGHFTYTENRKHLTRKAHRMAYVYTYGEIPDRMLVLHTCDTPSCVNPEHLFLGSNGDNMRDREAKGRGNHAEGHLSHRSKLSEKQVQLLRQLYAAGGHDQDELADMFGISQAQVSRVVLRLSYRNVI